MAETIFAIPSLAVADPERALALSYAPRQQRAGLAALWVLDETLGAILRGGRDAMVSQLRFTWWHEALSRLDDAPPPALPLLQQLAQAVLPCGVSGAELARMIDGWEVLLDPDPISDDALGAFAGARGGVLFAAAGVVLSGSERAEEAAEEAAGQGWALVDLARHSSDPALAARALALAATVLDGAVALRWHRAARPLGMLAHLAAVDARAGIVPLSPQGSPGRLLRMLRHRMTGR